MRPRGCVPVLALAGILAVSAAAGAQTAFPEAGEPVIALSFRGAHRAYPLALFPEVRVVNDVVGSMEIAVYHDPERDYSSAWFRTVHGEPIEFSGTADGTVADDLTTATRWDLETGVAVGGNLEGQRLFPVPFRRTTWAELTASQPTAQPFPAAGP